MPIGDFPVTGGALCDEAWEPTGEKPGRGSHRCWLPANHDTLHRCGVCGEEWASVDEIFTCPLCGMEFDDEGDCFNIHLPDCEAEQQEASGDHSDGEVDAS